MEDFENNEMNNVETEDDEKKDILFYDLISGRYFTSNIKSVRKAINTLNNRMMNDMYVSLSELYDELGLCRSYISEKLRWNIRQGLIEIGFIFQTTESGVPYVVLDYLTEPNWE